MNPRQAWSIDQLFGMLQDLVDHRTGIIRGVSEIPNQAGMPDFFHYAAEACDTSAFSSRRNFAESGGVSTDRKIAMAKAIGEAVERYCCTFYDQEDLPLSSSSSASFSTIEPDQFALFSNRQYSEAGFRYVPFSGDTPVRWTEALNISSNTTVHVPACMVFMPYLFDKAVGEQPIAQPISTGLACHCTWTQAVISAVCEVVERDAFTITWQAMMPARPIRIDSLSGANRDLVERFERTGGSIRILNLAMDHGIPCILSIFGCDEPRAPALVFAASSALNPEDAVRKSLEELAHTHRAAAHFVSTCTPFVPEPDYSNVTDQKTHFRLFTNHTQRHLADFLFSSQQWMNFSDLQDLSDNTSELELRHLINAISSKDYQVLVKELTTPDVRELGLFVVRAIIPGFHPLFMGHGNRALGGYRLWSIPQTLGYQGLIDRDNPAPHPYP